MIFILFRIELRKLRGTLALAVCAMAPLIVAIFAAAIAARQDQLQWRTLTLNGLALWTYFVLPMMIAALAALMAQIEHGPRAWDHLFALPVPRGMVIIAKAVVLMLLVGAQTLLLIVLMLGLGGLLGIPPASFPWPGVLGMAAMTWASAGLMAMLQLWVALAVRSFVAPIGLGLAGTFAVVSAMGAPASAILPWGMPLATLPIAGGTPMQALLAGSLGGLLLLPLIAVHLSRREF
jgi:hypothetical protein